MLDDQVETSTGSVWISNTNLTKWLKFRAVEVTARDDDVVPLQELFEIVGDDADSQEAYDAGRNLLYVACT